MWTYNMRSGRDPKVVYEIIAKEFSDDIEHHLYPAYVEVTKAVRSYRISEMMTKLYSSKSKANETVNNFNYDNSFQIVNCDPVPLTCQYELAIWEQIF